MTTVPHEPESADSSIEDLLREVGGRNEPSAQARQEVLSAVHAEWQDMLKQRRRQQRVTAWRVAAGMVLAVMVATFTYRYMAPAPAQVATVVNIDGHLLSGDDTDTAEARVGQPVVVGQNVQTDKQSRAALKLADNVSLRLDHDTLLSVSSPDQIELLAGAIYIDAPSVKRTSTALTIQTRAGSVQHVGTQYEVRTHADGIMVSVREGRVMVTSASGENSGEAGQVLRLSNSGEVTRSSISATDLHWRWTLQAAPSFDINNRSLADFLQWIARETGKQLTYASPEAQAAAAAVKLRGSIEGLEPDAALAAVLSTTQLRRYPTADAQIGIELASIDSRQQQRPTR